MIYYLDASALVKNYLQESYTADVRALFTGRSVVSTGLLSKAEVAAAFAKAARVGYITPVEARAAWDAFCQHWPALIRLRPTEPLITHAGELALQYGLRGYDAIHLATALHWQTLLGAPITLATFDRQLWDAAKAVGLAVWPGGQP
jgi:predicted nucleic acid-binding protein